MERRLTVHAGAHRQALIAVLALVCSPAAAAPKSTKAKVLFDKGVRLYTKGDYQAAADMLGKSAAIESDPETLFALAQTQRKLDHCDLAIPIYDRLLAMELPAENKDTIRGLLAECKQSVGATAPTEPPKEEPKPEPEPVREPEPAHEHERDAEPEPAPARAAATAVSSHAPEGYRWYQDPVGDTLVATGLVGIGVGVGFLFAASSADQDKATAPSYSRYLELSDRASTDGTVAVAGMIGGGVLVALGIYWYASHHDAPRAPVTGWIAPGGGGFGVAGTF